MAKDKSKIKQQMKDHIKNSIPQTDKDDVDKLMKKVETSLTEYEKIIKKYHQVMKDTDKILKTTKEKLPNEKKKKNSSFNEETVKLWIKEALTRKGIIEENKSYSHKPHLASLPYDHNTNDPDKLNERKEALEDRMVETEDILNSISDSIGYNQRSRIEMQRRLGDYEDELHRLDYNIGLFEDWEEECLNENKRIIKEDIIKPFEDENGFNFPNVIQNNYDNKVKPVLDKISNEYGTHLLSTHDLRVLDDAISLWEKEFNSSPYMLDSRSEDFNEELYDIYSAMKWLTTYDGYTHQGESGADFNREQDYMKNIDRREQVQEAIKDAQNHIDYWDESLKSDEKEFTRYSKINDDYQTEYDRTVAHIDRVTQ